MGTFNFYDSAELAPPHKVTRPEQVVELMQSLQRNGWVGVPLVGYLVEGGIQLLSGTHRRAAAQALGMKVPVLVYPYEIVKQAWGDLHYWQRLMTGEV